MEDVHQLRLLYNRNLQWRFTNAYADEMLSIQKMSAEVKSIALPVLIRFLVASVPNSPFMLAFLCYHIQFGSWNKVNNNVCIDTNSFYCMVSSFLYM
jgi:hypothetical protein